MKLLAVLREEGAGVLRDWFKRDEMPLGIYVVGTVFIAPLMPFAFAARVWKRMR